MGIATKRPSKASPTDWSTREGKLGAVSEESATAVPIQTPKRIRTPEPELSCAAFIRRRYLKRFCLDKCSNLNVSYVKRKLPWDVWG